MLNLPPNATFLFAQQPISMGLSFDGLLGVVRKTLGADPLSPTFFLFLNKRRDKIKVLYWDNDGFAIWYKRLEEGTFRLPLLVASEDGVIHLTRTQLAMLLEGLDFTQAERRKRFCREPRRAVSSHSPETVHAAIARSPRRNRTSNRSTRDWRQHRCFRSW